MGDSAAETIKPDHYIFRTIDNEPIKYDGNPAHIPGVLHEIEQCCIRTGKFVPLLGGLPYVLLHRHTA